MNATDNIAGSALPTGATGQKGLKVTLHHGDCLEVMRTLPDNSVDSIVTDPPYGLSFMGKKWDYDVPSVDVWREALRVLKPGGHLLAFAGTRTQHRMAVRIEDAGFEIRDMIAWVYGSGFPKSLDVSKAIDKAAGVVREVVGLEQNFGASTIADGKNSFGDYAGEWNITVPATEAARQWQGWGTALKPALEPITLARKPFACTVAENVLQHGTGAINVDGCRVGTETLTYAGQGPLSGRMRACNLVDRGDGKTLDGRDLANALAYAESLKNRQPTTVTGRWPANLILDGSEEVVAGFPLTSSAQSKASDNRKNNGLSIFLDGVHNSENSYADTGSAARFFANFPFESECYLCYNTYTKALNKDTEYEQWKNTLAHNAKKNSWTSKQISEFIALLLVMEKANKNLVQNVKSAGNLCDSCAMSIAVALVGIKTSAFSKQELQVILGCITKSESFILIRSLVLFVELWVSTDTIPTTQSLLLLFGYVHHATENYIRQGKKGKVVEDSGPAMETTCRVRYCSKASKKDRDEGLDGFEAIARVNGNKWTDQDYRVTNGERPPSAESGPRKNTHPTVKPERLMRYLCRLITPPGGTVLDCFMGSGSTGKGAVLEGFNFVGIEREADYLAIARARIEAAQQKAQFMPNHPAAPVVSAQAAIKDIAQFDIFEELSA